MKGLSIFAAALLGVLLVASLAYADGFGYKTIQSDPVFSGDLPICKHKDAIYEVLTVKLRHPLAWTGALQDRPGHMAMFENRKYRTWVLVAYKDGRNVACIVQSGTRSRNIFGRPT